MKNLDLFDEMMTTQIYGSIHKMLWGNAQNCHSGSYSTTKVTLDMWNKCLLPYTTCPRKYQYKVIKGSYSSKLEHFQVVKFDFLYP